MLKVTNSVGALIVASFLLVGSSGPAAGQVQAGLVNVNIQGVAVAIEADLDLLNNIDVNVQDIIALVTVQAPIGVAANVCPNFDIAAIAQELSQSGTATCTANQTSTALNRIVLRNLELD